MGETNVQVKEKTYFYITFHLNKCGSIFIKLKEFKWIIAHMAIMFIYRIIMNQHLKYLKIKIRNR